MTLQPNRDEAIALQRFNRLTRLWWLVVLCGILGGAAGLLLERLKPPVYDAQAFLFASIDFDKVGLDQTRAQPWSQADEDVALNVVQSVLESLRPSMLTLARQNGLSAAPVDLQQLFQVERRHAFWVLHVQNQDPALGQKVASAWAQAGYTALQAEQKAGKIQPYVYFDLVQLAGRPNQPLHAGTNVFVLCGGAIGLVLGLAAVGLPLGWTGRDG